jgi:radical SAM superfamily enzyme YgiQ (UPF0313 family)
MGRSWRKHSAGYVLRHLEFLVNQHHVKHIHFEDDNLTLNSARFQEILDGLLTRKMRITWDTPNGIRADSMTRELLEDSKRSGCTYIILGVESGDQNVLSRIIQKQLDLTRVIRMARWCKEIGLDVMTFFIVGFPGEKLGDMQKTVDFALELMREYDVTPTVFIATPLVGTRLYTICQEEGYLRKEVSGESLAMATGGGAEGSLITTKDFGPREIDSVMRRFIRGYKIIFLRNLIGFMIKNPHLLLKFVERTWVLTSEIGFKSSLLELAGLKNCFKRKLS